MVSQEWALSQDVKVKLEISFRNHTEKFTLAMIFHLYARIFSKITGSVNHYLHSLPCDYLYSLWYLMVEIMSDSLALGFENKFSNETHVIL